MKVSLGVVLIVIIVVVAVISGILALVPLLEASKASSFDIAQDFSVTISERISDRVQSIFEDLQFSVDTIQRAVNFSAIALDDPRSVLRWMGPIVSATTAERAFCCLDSGVSFLFHSPSTAGTSSDTVAFEIHNATDNTSRTARYNVTDATLTYNSTVGAATFLCQQQDEYGVIRSRRAWTAPFVDSATHSVFMVAGAPLFDPNTTNFDDVGAFGLVFNTNFLIEYLETSEIAETGVAVLLDTRNNSVLAYHLGISLSPTVVDSVTLRYRPRTPWELPNGRVQGSLAGLGASLNVCPTPCEYRLGASYLDTLFVRVDQPYSDYALTLRLLLVIPSGDFLSGIQTSIVIGSCSAVGAIIILATLSALLLFSCLRPLHRLEQRLYSIAVLREDTSSAPMSFLREIYNIEVAYAGMQAELMKMKSFLPQSVLRQLEEELADEDEDPPTSDSTAPTAKEDYGNDEVPTLHSHANPLTRTEGGTVDADDDAELDILLSAHSHTKGDSTHATVPGAASDEQKPVPKAALEMDGGEHHDADDVKGLGINLALPVEGGRHVLEGGLTAVNPLQVLNTGRVGGDSPDNQSLMTGASMCTAVVNLAISEKRKTRTTRPTLRSLNDLCVLSAKRVTVAMANVVGFHQVMEAQGAAGIEKFHATLLDTVLNEVNGTSGVLDFVHGDRFLTTYNASTTCIPHSVCAAEMILRVNAKLNAAGLEGYQGIRFGASSGEALCGNFGNDLMKRFSVVGPVVHQAFTLMQQTKAEESCGNARNLVCAAVYNRIKTRYAAEHINYVQLPGQTNAALISTIRCVRPNTESFESIVERTKVTFRRKKGPTAKEGMGGSGSGAAESARCLENSDVQEALLEATSMVDRINTAFETFACGEVENAKILAQEIPEERSVALRKAFTVCE